MLLDICLLSINSVVNQGNPFLLFIGGQKKHAEAPVFRMRFVEGNGQPLPADFPT
jgi:hypothetical protein